MVFDGGSPLSPQVARHLLKRFAPLVVPSRSEPKPGDLTSREIDILTRISQGFSVTETALQLEISHHTVSTHIKNIYAKLAVHNRVEAVNEARRKGLIH
jgi:DNA-binding NarL/FixJ family response regulator